MLNINIMKNQFLYLLILLFISISAIQSQKLNSSELGEFHHEVQDDSYVVVDMSTMERGTSYHVKRGGFFTSQVNVDAVGNDIIGDAANEPSIAIDPTNPDRIVIGWRQFDTITSNFRQAGYGYSLDGGQTWTFPGVINPGVFRSDPVLDFDAEGNFYYNSLTSGFACDVYKIDDGGVNWGSPVSAHGGDKQWMRIDKTDGIGAGNNYSNWNVSFSVCAPGDFTRSTDGSQSFENCVAVSASPRWGTLAVDGEGTLYISGTSNDSGEIILIKSTNAKDPSASVTWDAISVVDLDGFQGIGSTVNPQGLLGQVWVDVDVSGGSGDGNVYMLASLTRNSNSDQGDVMFAKSTDGGATFSTPTRINTDSGTDNIQWFGTMSVAPNGRIDIVWLDTRDAPVGTNDSALYYSFSVDQGDTWSVNQEISISFDPNIGYPQQNKMGDYFDMVSTNAGAHLAWANTINGGQDVYYSFIPPELTISVADNELENSFNLKGVPNPFSDEMTISFLVNGNQNVAIEVYDILGKKVTTILNDVVTGQQKYIWDGTNDQGAKLNNGLYFMSLKSENQKQTIRVVID